MKINAYFMFIEKNHIVSKNLFKIYQFVIKSFIYAMLDIKSNIIFIRWSFDIQSILLTLITLWSSVSFNIYILTLINILLFKVRWKINHSNDKSLSHYSFIRSNISIKFKLSKKRSDCEGYFNKFDLLNHFKWLLLSMIIKALSRSSRVFNIMNELNTLTFNIIEYEIKLLTTMWILNTFSRTNKWLMTLSKHFIEINSNNFVISSIWNLARKWINCLLFL